MNKKDKLLTKGCVPVKFPETHVYVDMAENKASENYLKYHSTGHDDWNLCS